MKKKIESSWEPAERWYGQLVGEKGHHYHQSVIIPGALKLLELKSGMSLLDIGCGSGVMARSIPKGVDYWGVDASKGLLQQARKMGPGRFLEADATKSLPIEKNNFDRCCFILSLQNMEQGGEAIRLSGEKIQPHGKLLLVLNHPCFRIARQSNWGIDETAKLQYRRMNCYLSAQKIPIQMHPAKGEQGGTTYSFHHPLSDISLWLHRAGFAIDEMQEWISDKKSEGARAKMEDRARKEFPLFLAILATKYPPIR